MQIQQVYNEGMNTGRIVIFEWTLPLNVKKMHMHVDKFKAQIAFALLTRGTSGSKHRSLKSAALFMQEKHSKAGGSDWAMRLLWATNSTVEEGEARGKRVIDENERRK